MTVRVPGQQPAGTPGGRPLRVGLVGLGARGRQHARVLGTLGGVRLVGVVDPAGDPFGAAPGTPVFAALADLLERRLDYAVVACPTAQHEETGLALAAHGVPVLIERPLAGSAAAAARLVAAFEARGLVAAVGHVERYHPAVAELRARLLDGELGRLLSVLTSRQLPCERRPDGTGVVLDLATHDLDLTRWLTGQEYATLAARTVRRGARGPEDAAVVVGELADGTMVGHQVGRLAPVRERRIAVTGERGCLVADTLAGTLVRHTAPPGEPVGCPLPGRDPLAAQHRQFREAVAGRPGRTVPLREGLRAVELAEDVLAQAGALRGDEVMV
ncbi:Gfo/Idh/MocA family oxidoreductase [Kitasatospora nipponensis]|uniref:Gfo/Idh/MocA family oxidoreductase n=1 Tax=Kitasatospora nipponensis TaxID=258049 RepID=A0ABN1WHK7_9ACTN